MDHLLFLAEHMYSSLSNDGKEDGTVSTQDVNPLNFMHENNWKSWNCSEFVGVL